MARALLATLAAVLVLAALPAGANEPVACYPPAEGVTVVTPSDYSGTIEAPLFFDDTVDQAFQLDLSPATALNKAATNVTLEWGVAANDFDLVLLDGEGNEVAATEGFQPIDPPVESASFGKLLHCSEFTVRALNYTAVGVPEPVDTLTVTIGVGAVQ